MKKIFHSERKNAILNSEHYDKVIIPIIRIIFIGIADEIRCSGFTWMRCTLRRQTAGVAEATLRFVDDERTVQTREDGVPNSSVVPKT